MAAFSQLPSGKWRVQVRRSGIYRAATFESKREAKDWAQGIESQANHIAASGYAPIPKGASMADLIDKYIESITKEYGRTKSATMAMLRRELGDVMLSQLNNLILRDFIDRREKAGAGGVTIAADLSYLSAILKWARHARQIDIPERLALDARASLTHRGLNTRSQERDREPTDIELSRLYEHWDGNPRQNVPMTMLCKFALASGMRQGEICRLDVEDLDRAEKTIIIRDRKDPKNKQGNHQKVPLLPDAWAIVEPLIKGRTSGFLFPYQASSVSAAFTRCCKNVEPPISDLCFHDLRHRATASFFTMGLDIPRVALLTGHKTWAMLRRYTAIKPSDVHDTISKASAAVLANEKTAQKDDGLKGSTTLAI
jgi:integrase